MTPALAAAPDLRTERALHKDGHAVVAGLDEVGRGAWAGPLSVGVAVMRPGVTRRTMPVWLRDSKLLSEMRRESIFTEVARWCAEWSVGHASPAECDRWGMTIALRLASLRALAGLSCAPDALLVDGPLDLVNGGTPAGSPPVDGAAVASWPAVGRYSGAVHPVVDGDARCASVAAASVLAKVVRDRLMREEAPHFPPYCFEHNKGYPSAAHQTALRGYGLSAIHRRSWAYVADLPWCDRWPAVRKNPL